MNQELRQAAAQAKEALLGVVRVFPTDTDMAEANWTNADINSACNAYDAARAALSALSAVLDSDSSHLAAPTGEARSGSGVPARPTLPGEDGAAFEAWYADHGGPQRMHRSYPPEYVERVEKEAAQAAWQARAALSAGAPSSLQGERK